MSLKVSEHDLTLLNIAGVDEGEWGGSWVHPWAATSWPTPQDDSCGRPRSPVGQATLTQPCTHTEISGKGVCVCVCVRVRACVRACAPYLLTYPSYTNRDDLM